MSQNLGKSAGPPGGGVMDMIFGDDDMDFEFAQDEMLLRAVGAEDLLASLGSPNPVSNSNSLNPASRPDDLASRVTHASNVTAASFANNLVVDLKSKEEMRIADWEKKVKAKFGIDQNTVFPIEIANELHACFEQELAEGGSKDLVWKEVENLGLKEKIKAAMADKVKTLTERMVKAKRREVIFATLQQIVEMTDSVDQIDWGGSIDTCMREVCLTTPEKVSSASDRLERGNWLYTNLVDILQRGIKAKTVSESDICDYWRYWMLLCLRPVLQSLASIELVEQWLARSEKELEPFIWELQGKVTDEQKQDLDKMAAGIGLGLDTGSSLSLAERHLQIQREQRKREEQIKAKSRRTIASFIRGKIQEVRTAENPLARYEQMEACYPHDTLIEFSIGSIDVPLRQMANRLEADKIVNLITLLWTHLANKSPMPKPDAQVVFGSDDDKKPTEIDIGANLAALFHPMVHGQFSVQMWAKGARLVAANLRYRGYDTYQFERLISTVATMTEFRFPKEVSMYAIVMMFTKNIKELNEKIMSDVQIKNFEQALRGMEYIDLSHLLKMKSTDGPDDDGKQTEPQAKAVSSAVNSDNAVSSADPVSMKRKVPSITLDVNDDGDIAMTPQPDRVDENNGGDNLAKTDKAGAEAILRTGGAKYKDHGLQIDKAGNVLLSADNLAKLAEQKPKSGKQKKENDASSAKEKNPKKKAEVDDPSQAGMRAESKDDPKESGKTNVGSGEGDDDKDGAKPGNPIPDESKQNDEKDPKETGGEKQKEDDRERIFGGKKDLQRWMSLCSVANLVGNDTADPALPNIISMLEDCWNKKHEVGGCSKATAKKVPKDGVVIVSLKGKSPTVPHPPMMFLKLKALSYAANALQKLACAPLVDFDQYELPSGFTVASQKYMTTATLMKKIAGSKQELVDPVVKELNTRMLEEVKAYGLSVERKATEVFQYLIPDYAMVIADLKEDMQKGTSGESVRDMVKKSALNKWVKIKPLRPDFWTDIDAYAKKVIVEKKLDDFNKKKLARKGSC